MARALSTSTSILIAGGMIAIGVYLGLRDRGEPRASVDAAPPAVDARSAAPSAGSDPSALAAQYARAALELHRPALTQRCWDPLRADGGSATTVVTFDLSFSADGQQLARGITEERATAVPGLGQCVQGALPMLHIPPIGAPARVEVALPLP